MGQESRPAYAFPIIALKTTTAAITSDTAETAVTAAALKHHREGFALVNVSAFDETTGDETGNIIIEGRTAGSSGAYTALGNVPMDSAGAAPFNAIGLFRVNLPKLMGDMRVRIDVGGDTPSFIYTCIVVVTKTDYLLDESTSIIDPS